MLANWLKSPPYDFPHQFNSDKYAHLFEAFGLRATLASFDFSVVREKPEHKLISKCN